MNEPLKPGWYEKQEEPPKRCFRESEADREASRQRGLKRGRAARWALRTLPPIEEDEP